METSEDLQPLPLRDDDHKTYIETSLKLDDCKLVSTTLFDNTDLFAWITADMPGVSPDVITHFLSIYKEARPITQKNESLEKKDVIAREEAGKLIKDGIIRKAHYTTWLANVVMVKKSNGNWRMCRLH